MNLPVFFIYNYSTYVFVFASQLAISRMFGLEAFGQYAIFLALMAIIEAPIISARSDSALLVLNSNMNNKFVILKTIISDIKSTIFLTPIIFTVTLYQFDLLIACFAVVTVAFQSGYASAKNFFVVHQLRKQYAIIEFFLALFGLVLIVFVGLIDPSFHALVAFYSAFAAIKNISLFIYLLQQSRISFIRDGGAGSYPYQPNSLILLFRSLSLNAISNLDILILATILDLQQVGVYKITKTCAALLFRLIAPFWRWEIYNINKGLSSSAISNYSISQMKGGIMAISLLIVTLPWSHIYVEIISNYLFGVTISANKMHTHIIFINTFLVLWFLSWYKIDALYRANKILTLGIPLSYCLFWAIYSSVIVDLTTWLNHYIVSNLVFVTITSSYLLILRRKDGFVKTDA